jgi:glycosyl transferase family 87
MTQAESDSLHPTAWQNGLLLALLVWLLTTLAYNRNIAYRAQPGESAQISDPAPMRTLLPRPWSPLSRPQVARFRFAACLFCLLLSTALFIKAAGISLGSAAPAGVVLITAFHFDPTAIDFRRAPFELPLLALLCAAYFFDSRGRPYRMAACVAIAGLIQNWMLALLLYPLARRKPLAGLFGLALFGGLMTLLLAGAGFRTPSAFGRAAVRFMSLGTADGLANQSLFGVARALLAPDPEAPLLMFTAVAIGFVLILSGLFFATGRTPAAGGDHARLLLGLATVSLLLALPVSKRTDFLLLLPAIWTLLICDVFSPFARAVALIVYAALADSVFAEAFASVFFVAAAAIWAALLLAIGQIQRKPAEPLPWALT